ncbi:MAG TPA: hypothetical protein VFM65_08970 [Flavobacteriaceae bacterium]|nr:hypothetical protein [Flavobacteriaceae bacterium]
MIYRFRVVLDVLDDVFRDIEIRETDTLEDLHNAISQAFGFEGTEMASFYTSDEEWNQGEEIVLFDMSEGMNSVRMMNETILNELLSEKETKLIYVYDFLNMWTFYVELAEITEPINGTDYPNLLFSHGVLPESPPDKQFEAEEGFDDFDDDPDFESFDDPDFDEQWN